MGAAAPSLNSEGLQQLLGQLVTDVGAAVNGALVILGDRLGIYAAWQTLGRPPRSNSLPRPAWTSVSFVNG